MEIVQTLHVQVSEDVTPNVIAKLRRFNIREEVCGAQVCLFFQHSDNAMYDHNNCDNLIRGLWSTYDFLNMI